MCHTAWKVWQQSCGCTDGHITATIREQRIGRKSGPPVAHYLHQDSNFSRFHSPSKQYHQLETMRQTQEPTGIRRHNIMHSKHNSRLGSQMEPPYPHPHREGGLTGPLPPQQESIVSAVWVKAQMAAQAVPYFG